MEQLSRVQPVDSVDRINGAADPHQEPPLSCLQFISEQLFSSRNGAGGCSDRRMKQMEKKREKLGRVCRSAAVRTHFMKYFPKHNRYEAAAAAVPVPDCYLDVHGVSHVCYKKPCCYMVLLAQIG